MRIVLDTNVFISGIFFGGPPSQILQAWKEKKLQIVLSQEIVEEYQRVSESLAGRFPTIDISSIIDLVTINGQLVETTGFEISVCVDPDDNKFIECALAGKTKIVVSGDKHLLNLSGFRTIVVHKPREFVNLYLKPTGSEHS